jgi:hypothetical protein
MRVILAMPGRADLKVGPYETWRDYCYEMGRDYCVPRA